MQIHSLSLTQNSVQETLDEIVGEIMLTLANIFFQILNKNRAFCIEGPGNITHNGLPERMI